MAFHHFPFPEMDPMDQVDTYIGRLISGFGYFRRALLSSAGIDRGMTGGIVVYKFPSVGNLSGYSELYKRT